MHEISYLDMSTSNIRYINGDVISTIQENIKYLNIANNSMKYLPRAIAVSHNITELRISNNPYECNCDMMWMRDWLVQATNVKDKENATCSTGKMKGRTYSTIFLQI